MEDIDSILLRQKEEINQLKKELEYKKYGTNETTLNSLRCFEYSNRSEIEELRKENDMLRRKIKDDDRIIREFQCVAKEANDKITMAIGINERIKKENELLKRKLKMINKDNTNDEEYSIKKDIKTSNCSIKKNDYSKEYDKVIKDLKEQNNDLTYQNKQYKSEIEKLEQQIRVLNQRIHSYDNRSTTIHSNSCCLYSRYPNFQIDSLSQSKASESNQSSIREESHRSHKMTYEI